MANSAAGPLRFAHHSLGMPGGRGTRGPCHGGASPIYPGGNMRRFVAAACATGLGVALSSAFAMSASALAARTIVVRPGHSIQAAVKRARPGDTVLVKPGVYHQTVQIRKNGITLRGSGAGRGGTVLRPPASAPKTLCNQAFGPTGVCVLARKLDTKTGAVLSAVRNDTVRGLRIIGFPASGVFGYGTDGLRVTRTVAIK